jgi:predicted dehydrogenase
MKARAGKVPLVIVGAGKVARTIHLPIWKRTKQVEIVAVCDVNKDVAKNLAKEYSIPYVYESLEEMLEEWRGGTMIVDICTPAPTHASLSIAAMRRGHHVLLEKPMATSIEECEQILREYQARRNEVKLCVIHNFLFDPPMLKVRELAKEDEILGVEIHMLHTPEDEMLSDPNHWIHSLPGGRFGENLIHPIYFLRNLIGPLKLRDLYVTKRGRYEWVKFDELWATFTSNGGRYGVVHVSFNSPRWTADFSINIYGKRSIVKYDGSNFTLIKQGTLMKGFIYTERIPKLKVAWDCVACGLQAIKTPFDVWSKLLLKRWTPGHEVVFRSFLKALLNNTELPYPPEEAFESTKTFLEVIAELSHYEA